MIMKTRFMADFETTTDELDCRVWSWGTMEILDEDSFQYGNNIDGFLDFCRNSNNATFYFHNLAFDGEFILDRLFELGFKHVRDKKELESKTFTTLISDTGQFYSLKIVFERKGKRVKFVDIYDSAKLLPFSVKQIAKDFKLPIEKQEIDYHTYRKVGHILTPDEIHYLKYDVLIVASALNSLFEQGFNKMTNASNALFDYKNTIGSKMFERWFPIPWYDEDVRRSYRGGFTYLNPLYKEKEVGEGLVFDVNSLYPSVMRYKPIPYGEGIYFEGQYKDDFLYNLYVQTFTCQFELKENKIPTVQLKNSLAFIETEYLTSSGDEEVTMCMTSVDLELFFEHYEVYNIEYHSGWKFKSSTGLFADYVDKWSDVKIQSKKDGNFAMYVISKLMLNALYGRMALNPNVRSKIPYYDDRVKYMKGEKETRNPIYIPAGTFITSWARHITITSAQKVYHRFIYADTDSLHLTGTEIPEDLEIDDSALGKWKHEGTFKRAKYLRAKTYLETFPVDDRDYEKLEDSEKERCYILDGERVKDMVVCASLPHKQHKYVNWNNFKYGTNYEGKLQKTRVKGGVVLKEGPFELKRKKND